MFAHASQAFSTTHCTDSEDLPLHILLVKFEIQNNGNCSTFSTIAHNVAIENFTANRAAEQQ